MPLPLRITERIKFRGTCWIWTGACNSVGYGHMRWNGRHVFVHRLAYELSVGPIPQGLEIDHVAERGCVSRACCNPAHLEPVTHAENVRRGRLTDLSPADVEAIRRAPGLQREIALRFGVGQPAISRIRAGHRWAA